MGLSPKNSIIAISVSSFFIVVMLIVIIMIVTKSNKSSKKHIILEKNGEAAQAQNPNARSTRSVTKQPTAAPLKARAADMVIQPVSSTIFSERLPGFASGARGGFSVLTSSDLRKYIRRGDPIVLNNQLFVVSDERDGQGTFKYSFTAKELPLDRSNTGLWENISGTEMYTAPWVSKGDKFWSGARGGVRGNIHSTTKQWIQKKMAHSNKQVSGKEGWGGQNLRPSAQYDRVRDVDEEGEAARRKERAKKALAQRKAEAMRQTNQNNTNRPPLQQLPTMKTVSSKSNEIGGLNDISRANKNDVPTTPAFNYEKAVPTSASLYNSQMLDANPDAEVKHHGGASLNDLQQREKLETFTEFSSKLPLGQMSNNSLPEERAFVGVNEHSREKNQDAVSSAIWDRMRSSALKRVEK